MDFLWKGMKIILSMVHLQFHRLHYQVYTGQETAYVLTRH